ncbi:MAG: TnsA endonuclease N-terminal domain-containing protein [Bacteroidetes bacterium]|nr:TnsA endonuclease N-terminal domain-containing protein [Bacteroidota bacterium]
MQLFKPVRQIGFKHRSVAGLQHNIKNGEKVQFESSLERDFITILNADYCVSEFVEQPMTIRFDDESGRSRSYTPDFLVRYKDDFSIKQLPTLFEVKYRKDLFQSWKDLKPKFKAAMKYADSRKWKFKIITEKEIRTDFLRNAEFLWRYKFDQLNSGEEMDLKIILLARLKELSLTTPQELILASSKSILMRGKLLHALWSLVANGQVGCDLNIKLNMNSEIWDI